MTHLLDMPAKELLKEFGKGKGMTGAGASVALGAIAATQILVSVCKLTAGKETYATAHAPLADIQQKLEAKYIPVLEAIMQADAVAVENMLRLRLARDNEPDEAKK
jgi:formiminotetrahydrofolate cyclodeaminase